MNTKTGKTFNLSFIIFCIIVSVFGAIIGMQIVTTLGITPNTSIIGALVAMVVARIPISMFYRYKSLETQNLVQTSISSATFGAANSLLIPIGIPFAMGRTDLILPMFIGSAFALIVDALILYKVFDSKLFPAEEAWPPGIATAESLKAGDEGGKRAGFLGIGILAGLIGSWIGIPMSALGVAFIGNIWALTMFGAGLLLEGYAKPLFGVNLDAHYIPHGMMIGAGLIALIQFIATLFKHKKNPANEEAAAALQADKQTSTRTDQDVKKAFSFGFLAFFVGILLTALFGGLFSSMSVPQLILFMLFAALAGLAHEVIVGIAAMHSGWFPAFAVSLISLIIGMLIGFPPLALALLVGYTSATGPAFADLGYDFKSGFLIRDRSQIALELKGRKLQLKAGFIGFIVAIIMVALFHHNFFSQNLVPPVDRVYATTIKAGLSGGVGLQLLLWAIPGALIQLIGGPKRQLGIMFATGLLIVNPLAGWAVIAGILIRVFILKWKGKEAESVMYTTAAGFIAGDALYSFFSSIFQARIK
ncbi:OPT/YSL family transporter [Scopulibacillus cellulosilyticus]|uniref:OPT/YSL family transporter n=1 Tax=Scopulibacillus cellulosilyticus TaxID=2665665 RepID=A0ABW2Q1B7_9BACL